ncbi:MAG: heavy-metal-associated domain-containing protein [Actinomycetia bacterium]|nr:heavy-metal-associated domain-containing protein [Actinomycetes bacterium]
MATQTFRATGLTCDHCAAAVADEVGELDGVQSTNVTAVKDGVSTIEVNADRDLSDEEIAAALDEAGGYVLVPAEH